MKLLNTLQKISLTCAIAAIPLMPCRTSAQTKAKPDAFLKIHVEPKGSYDKNVLKGAPCSSIRIMGENKTAKIIVDLSRNILYKYDIQGNAEAAYLIASGKKSTPTDKGVRIVTHTETYPYRTAPRHTKRRRNPGAYGPRVICLNKLNTETGEQDRTGEFIHGTNNLKTLGKYVSQGCMRMDNEVIKQLAKEVKRGDIIVIQ